MDKSEVMKLAHSKAKKIVCKLFNRLSYKEAFAITLAAAWHHFKSINTFNDNLESWI